MDENEELENELVVNDSVPETLEETDDVQVDTSENEEQSQEISQTNEDEQEDINKQIEEKANQMFEEKVEERLARDRSTRERQREKEMAKYRQMESVMKAGLGVESLEEAIEEASKFYKEQGIDIPEYEPIKNKKDAEILGNYDAQNLIDTAEFNEIKSRANELADLKAKGKISLREETEFMNLGKYLTNELKIRELKSKGLDTKILENKEFKEFLKKFNNDEPISEIYEMYTKINKPKEEVIKPVSTGSTRDNNTTQDETFFTKEEVKKMSKKEVKNNFEKIRKSMETWDI